ncbi:MAG: RebB family R body protein [Myxococcota bacterium]
MGTSSRPRTGSVEFAAVNDAPTTAMAMTYVASADSMGLAMHNAVANQQRGQVLATVATTVVTGLIIRGGTSS